MDAQIEMDRSCKPSMLAGKNEKHDHHPPPGNQSLSEEVSRSRIRITAILLALSLSLFISALDTTIVATAIPTISADLHAASGYLWIGGAYILAAAAGAPLWAKLSDIWGRKPILLAAVAWFAGSSILCARAKTIEMLIIGRAFQGTAGGGLIQLVNIVVSDMFSMRLVAVHPMLDSLLTID
ncbi:MAG: hypothetical protein Q9204_009328 [Flavoplaca sp. TL-2023a]